MGLDITGIGEVADLAKTLVNKFFPDKSEEEKALLAASMSIIQGQLDINKVEAANPSVFVSGARPAAIWVCNIGLLYSFLLYPFATWISSIYSLASPPNNDMGTLVTMLGSLLGLGTLRTIDKINGVASK